MPAQLILGGARSGKSGYAQRLAESSDLPVNFIVTAEIRDAEMAQRIALHQATRPKNWNVIEAPFDLPTALGEARRAGQFVLVDCITLWLSNILCQHPEQLAKRCDSLIAAVVNTSGTLVLVSNEVGWGIVPESPLGREFRDEAGRLNQRLAAACDKVTLVIAGLPMHLK